MVFAAISMKKGLTSSIGWNLGKITKSNHLFDPLISMPKNGTKISSKTEAEEDMLDQLHNSDITKSRLICQIPLSKKLNGILLRLVR